MSIADNLQRVRERIAAAAESAGRKADEITLVGVTKYVGPREVAELVAAGCRDLGESRPQELWNKFDVLSTVAASLRDADAKPVEPAPAATRGTVPFRSEDSAKGDSPRRSSVLTPLRWHLVGHLQRNKVRRTLPLVSLIHSVDSERLLSAIDEAQAAGEAASPVHVLLEINTSGEPAKHGLAPNAVEPLLIAAPQYRRVAIRGLMTMAALEGGEAVAASNFASLRELRDSLKLRAPECVQLDELSMGMSDDFEVAIREGATIVRIGSLLWN